MPSSLPLGLPAPADGRLPPSAALGSETRLWGAYLHVPFCRVRCGYCDFNTYTASELPGVSREGFEKQLIQEVAFSAGVLRDSGVAPRRLSTVFFGGGTPTLLEPGQLAAVIHRLGQEFGLVPGAEVTVEANPDSVNRDILRDLASAGVTRVSFGAQSFTPHVLKVLDRTHDPDNVGAVVGWARQAGLQVSLDLIYATPGESADDWRYTLSKAIALSPDHLSAYSLIVEPGTALARLVSKGDLAEASEDTQAEYYEIAEGLLNDAGFEWYEVSNWARGEECQSRHNLGYWRSHDWWGYGPGAHSHVGGVRWWNKKHPVAWAKQLREGFSPAQALEQLTETQQRLEGVMLRLRTAEGLAVSELGPRRAPLIARAISQGYLDPGLALRGVLRLTVAGRLVADYLARELSESWPDTQ